MRLVALFFGLVGVICIGFAGGMSMMFRKEFLTFLNELQVQKTLKEYSDLDLDASTRQSLTNIWHGEVGVIFLIAAGLGLLGTLLALCRCGWQGALLMIIPAICAAIANPVLAPLALPMMFAGLVSFLVFPKPINAPAPAADEDDDD
jgi:hypothetical protein